VLCFVFVLHSNLFNVRHCRCRGLLFHLITQWHTHSFGRTPLNEWCALRSGLYLHNTRQTQETNIYAPGGIRNRGQTYALDHTATGLFHLSVFLFCLIICTYMLTFVRKDSQGSSWEGCNISRQIHVEWIDVLDFFTKLLCVNVIWSRDAIQTSAHVETHPHFSSGIWNGVCRQMTSLMCVKCYHLPVFEPCTLQIISTLYMRCILNTVVTIHTTSFSIEWLRLTGRVCFVFRMVVTSISQLLFVTEKQCGFSGVGVEFLKCYAHEMHVESWSRSVLKISYYSYNKQWLFPKTSLTGWYLYAKYR
jgi:hypothetical protein